MAMNIAIIMFLLTNAISSYAADDPLLSLKFPKCPFESQKFYFPESNKPLWIGCRDKKKLYQGYLVQLSTQGEVLRISGVKNSLRHGKEIRFGNRGYMEERSYIDGQLTEDSLIFKTDTVLARVMPKEMSPQDWQAFDDIKSPSILSAWLKQEPVSVIHFENGRMSRLRFDKKEYNFKVTPEGRMMAKNHPDMKGLFFVDTLPMWNLGSDDIRRLLLPGFGSCKKYSGPIGRFGRHYDHLLYVRQSSEAKYIANLAEIRKRFIDFCVPKDIIEHLGVLECPPQLPKMMSPDHCLIPVSTQLKIPYQPKYFTFEYSAGKSPEEFMALFGKEKLLSFMSDPDKAFISLFIPPKTMIIVKKTEKKIKYRVLPEHTKSPNVLDKDLEDKNWWEWRAFPGSE